MILADDSGRIRRVNLRFVEQIGHSRANVIGRDLRGILQFEGDPRDLSGTPRLPAQLTGSDGQPRPVMLAITPLRVDRLETLGHLIAIHLPKSEPSAARPLSGGSEPTIDDLRMALDVLPVSAAILEPTGRVIACNEALSQLSGWSRDEFIGSDWFALVTPNPGEHHATFCARITTGRFPDQEEAPFVQRSGESCVMLWKQLPILDKDGVCAALGLIGLDVTGQVQVEQRLRDSERRFRQAIQAAKAGAWEWNMATGQAIWSDDNYRVLGLTPGSEAPSYSLWLRCVHPEDRVEAERRVNEAVQKLENLDMEYRVVWSDGSTHWIEDIGQIVCDDSGRPSGMFGIQIDITRRHQAESQLRQSELRFRALTENSWDVVATVDAQGAITYVNGAVQRILGYPTDGSSDPDAFALSFLHPDDLPLVSSCIKQTLAQPGQPFTLEIRARRHDGGYAWLEVVLTNHLGDPAVGSIIVNARDVTERRLSETQLRESEARFQQVLEHMPVLLTAIDAGGRIVNWNAECERVTGFDRSDLVNLAEGLERLFPLEAERQHFVEALRPAIPGRHASEVPITTRDGKTRLVEWSTVDPTVAIPGWSAWAIGVDLTARREAELALRENERELAELFQISPDGLCISRVDTGAVLLVNPGLATLTGYSAAETAVRLSESFGRWLDPDQIKPWTADLYKVGGVSNLEIQLRHQTGQTITALVSARPMPFKGQDCILTTVRDISDRKRSAVALQASEERYRLITELMSDFAFAYDFGTDGSLGSVWITTESFTRLTGYPTHDMANLDRWRDSLHPGDFERVVGTLAEIYKGESVESEWRLRDANGIWRWLRSLVRPRLGAAGQVIGFVGAAHDITAVRQAQLDLRASEERSRSILEALAEGIVLLDPTQNVSFANGSARRIIGNAFHLADGQVALSPGWTALHADGTDFAIEDHPTLVTLRTGQPQTNVVIGLKSPEDRTIWISVTSRPVDDVASAVLTSFTEITGFRQAEESLQAETNFRLAIEAAVPSGLILTAPDDHRILYVNDVFCQMVGFTASELVGAQPPYPYWPQTQWRSIQTALDDDLAGRQSEAGHELRFQRKDGTRFDALVLAAPVIDDRGQPRGLLASFSDITTLTDTTAKLRRHAKRLEVLRELSHGILAAHSPAEVARAALRDLESLIPHQHAWVFLNDLDSGLPTILAERGNSRASSALDARLDFSHAQQLLTPTDAWLISPLKSGSTAIGALVLAQTNPGTFDSDDADIAGELAVELAIAIEQARLQQAEIRQRLELEALSRVSAALRVENSSAGVGRTLLHQTVGMLQAERGLLLSNPGLWTPLCHWPSVDSHIVQAAPPDTPDLTTLWASASTEPFLVTAPFSGAYSVLEELLPGVQACAGIPMRLTDQMRGLMLIGWPHHYEYSAADQHTLVAIAELGSNALQRSTLLETLENRVSARTRDLATIYEVTALTNDILDEGQLLRRALAITLRAVSSPSGAVYLIGDGQSDLVLAAEIGLPAHARSALQTLPVGASLEGQVFRQGEPVVLGDLASAPSALRVDGVPPGLGFAGLPIRHQGQTHGVLVVINADSSQTSAETVALLGTIADQIGAMLVGQRLHQQAEQAAVVEERQRLARDLHDSVTQTLYSAILFASAAETHTLSGKRERAQEHLEKLNSLLKQALRDMRLLIYELRPGLLTELGLVQALRHRLEAVENRAQIKHYLTVDGEVRLPERIEAALYSIAQEALTNALKHSGATEVSVHIQASAQRVALRIADNGRGFEVHGAAERGGAGLRNMQERVTQLGGSFRLASAPEQGTQLEVELKL